MKIIGLYRCTNSDGSISITPEKRAKTDIENQYRLIADEGKVITDGKETYYCIDTHNVEQFTEIPIDPTPEPETDLTVNDTLKMLNELGVETDDK